MPPNAVTPAGAAPPSTEVIGGATKQMNVPPSGSGGSRLNIALSPKDYNGPFIGVRPKAIGESFIVLNGAESYEEWVYTADDLVMEINQKNAALNTK